MPPAEPVEVFISYAQEDESLCEELEKHLKTLQRQNVIAKLYDREIVAGTDLKDEINPHLNRAGIILLLVSPDFIASDYHWTVEVTRALERNTSGKARVIAVLLRYADWETYPINQFLPLPSNRQPVKSASWTDQDAAFLEIIKGIREEATKLTTNPNYLVEERVATEETEKLEKQATILLNEAYKLREKGNWEEASAKFKEALQYSPENIQACVNLGFALEFLGKPDEAIPFHRQSFQLDPNYETGHNLGHALKEQGKLSEAIAVFRQTIQFDPNHAGAHFNLGTALAIQGELDEAIVSFRQAVYLDPNHADCYFNLGLSLSTQEKLDEAVTALNRAMQLDSVHTHACNNLGMQFYEQGKLNEAIAIYRQIIQLEPSQPPLYKNLGLALREQGKLDEAIAAYRQAIQLDPNDADTYFNLGFALYNQDNQGNLDDAIYVLRQAVELDPDDEFLHSNLNFLLKEQGQKKKFFGLF